MESLWSTREIERKPVVHPTKNNGMYEIFREAKVACGLSHLAKVTHWRGVGAMYAESEYEL